MRCTDSPSSSIRVHVTVDIQGHGGASRIDGVHPAGGGVVMAMDVITVDGQVELWVGLSRGFKNQHRYQKRHLDTKKERD